MGLNKDGMITNKTLSIGRHGAMRSIRILRAGVRRKNPTLHIMKLLICSILLCSASVVFALPPVYVNLSDQAYAGTYDNPYNNDNYVGGTNSQHSSSTGFVAQSSGSVGDIASSTWKRDDVVTSPIGDGSGIPVTWNADATAAASGLANMGALHATCRAVQEIKPFSVSYAQTDTNGDSFENTSYNPLIATGSASVNVGAQDAVSVIGTLPAGTMVRIQLGLAVDCVEVLSGGGTDAQVTAQAYCNVQTPTRYYSTQTLNFDTLYDGTSIKTNEVFYAPVGATIYVVQSLSVDASASSDLGNSGAYQPLSAKPPVSSATADAGNTAKFYLDVLDPGASLSSASGHNYSMPPQLALVRTNAPGLTLSAACLPLQTWVLQSSSNMVNWVDAGTNQADSNGQLQIALPTADAPSKFYRFRSP